MAISTTSLNLTTDTTFSFSKKKVYSEQFVLNTSVDDSDGFITLVKFASDAIAAQSLRSANTLVISNSGNVSVEIRLQLPVWTAGTPDTGGTTTSYSSVLLHPDEYYMIPNSHIVDYSASSSACGGASISNTAPKANGKWSSGSTDGTTKVAQLDGAVADAAGTTITIEDADSDSNGKIEDIFMAGDYIRTSNEVLLVTGVTTDDSGVLTVERGQLGSTAATHSDQAQIYFFHYNSFVDFDKFSDVRTDENGKFSNSNYFGYGRVYTGGGTDRANRGLVAGSCAVKFYNAGYQELGLSNITSSTSTGLAVSTEYGFDITVDGSGLLDSDALKFTTDSSNVNWGGTNGVISKIQDVFDTQYRTTSSNILGERVTMGIVNGDIRFTSGQNLSTSAILLAAPSAGETTPFGVGAIPAIANVQGAVIARLDDDTFINRDGITVQNTSPFLLDNGDGTMTRGNGGSGTINYETGALTMAGCPPMASFVVTTNYASALAGGYQSSSAYGKNQITAIQGRSVNQKADASLEIVALY